MVNKGTNLACGTDTAAQLQVEFIDIFVAADGFVIIPLLHRQI